MRYREKVNIDRKLGKNNSAPTTRSQQDVLIFTERAWSAVSGTEMHQAVREARRLPTGEALGARSISFSVHPLSFLPAPGKFVKSHSF